MKNYPSSFSQTDLGAQLEGAGRHDLVLAATLQAATLAGVADLFAVVADPPDDLPGWPLHG